MNMNVYEYECYAETTTLPCDQLEKINSC